MKRKEKNRIIHKSNKKETEKSRPMGGLIDWVSIGQEKQQMRLWGKVITLGSCTQQESTLLDNLPRTPARHKGPVLKQLQVSDQISSCLVKFQENM
jgi:hypothetical protein